MNHIKIFIASVVFALSSISTVAAVKPLRIGVQCYSYKNYSFEETINQVARMGIKYVELYPGQTLQGMPGKKTNHREDFETIEYIRKTAEANGITIISYGVVHAPNEQQWKKVFEFSKALGIEVILTEGLKGPKKAIIERFSKEYNIRVALHNHPTPTPDEVFTDLRSVGNNPLIGSGMDIGHWTRAGYNIPAEVDRFSGRIFTMHIKDMNVPGMGGRCVPLGTGIVPLNEILGKLLLTGYSGALIIEYEGHWDNPSPGIAKSKAWLDNYFKNAEKPEKVPDFVAADQISILYAQRNLLRKQRSHLVDAAETKKTDTDLSGSKSSFAGVHASGTEGPGREAKNAIDGNMKTRWASKRADDQWLVVDLDEEKEVQGVVIYWEAAYGRNYDIDVSQDGKVWQTAYSQRDGKGGEEHIRFETPVKARFVRMKGVKRATRFSYSIFEFEVIAE